MTRAFRLAALLPLLAGCAPDPDTAPQLEPAAGEQQGAEAAAGSPRQGGAGASAAAAEPGAPPLRVSQYTSLGDCRVVVSRPDEAGYSSSLCPGTGGYSVRVVDADARQNLFVRGSDGTETSLALSEAAGSGFSRLGERIEWRGRTGQNGFAPDALVVRYFVVEAEGEDEVSYLLPVTLRGAGAPCVAERIAPGTAQSERAREVIDGEMRCLQPHG